MPMILISGTISSAVSLQVMQNKWQQKKQSGNVLSKEERNARGEWTQEDWLINNYKEQMEKEKEASAKRDILYKIMEGETLTPEEESYIESEDPAAYEKYKQAKSEKKSYEEKLKKCRTKDEVERLKTQTVTNYLSTLKKIDSNPYISDGDKLAKAQEITAKVNNIEKADTQFRMSAQYAALKTEAEEAKSRSDERNYESEDRMEEANENRLEDEAQLKEQEAAGVENAQQQEKYQSDTADVAEKAGEYQSDNAKASTTAKKHIDKVVVKENEAAKEVRLKAQQESVRLKKNIHAAYRSNEAVKAESTQEDNNAGRTLGRKRRRKINYTV